MTGQDEPGEFQWSERWLVIRGERHAKKQPMSFLKCLENAEKAIKSSIAKGTESAADGETCLKKTLEEQEVSPLITVQGQETTHRVKHYLRPGRPTADQQFLLSLFRSTFESHLEKPKSGGMKKTKPILELSQKPNSLCNSP